MCPRSTNTRAVHRRRHLRHVQLHRQLRRPGRLSRARRQLPRQARYGRPHLEGPLLHRRRPVLDDTADNPVTATGAVSELRFPRLTLLAVFAVLAVVHTWPLASAPSYYSRLDTADAQLNTWAMAWVARTLPTDPRHLFDASIFYPEKRTLAYSEPLIVQGALAIPVDSPWRIAGAGLQPRAARRLRADGMGGGPPRPAHDGQPARRVVGGSIAAFNAQSLVRLPHIQAQHLEFLPLALFAFDRLLEQRSPEARGPARRGGCVPGVRVDLRADLRRVGARLCGGGRVKELARAGSLARSPPC